MSVETNGVGSTGSAAGTIEEARRAALKVLFEEALDWTCKVGLPGFYDLVADVRHSPAFAAARRAAVKALFEEAPGWICKLDIPHFCESLRGYEAARGSLRDPGAIAKVMDDFAMGYASRRAAIAAYEREGSAERGAQTS